MMNSLMNAVCAEVASYMRSTGVKVAEVYSVTEEFNSLFNCKEVLVSYSEEKGCEGFYWAESTKHWSFYGTLGEMFLEMEEAERKTRYAESLTTA